MDICGKCEREKAGFLCLCSEPLVQLCSGCIGLHVLESPSNGHSLEPFASREFLKSQKDIPRYRSRQIAIHLANSALDQNLTALAAFKSQISDLQSTVNNWATEKLSALSAAEAQLVKDLAACRDKTRELGFITYPVVDSKLVAMVVGASYNDEEAMKRELCMFQSQIARKIDVERLLEETFQYQVTASPLHQAADEPANPFNSITYQEGVEARKAFALVLGNPANVLSASSTAAAPFVFGAPPAALSKTSPVPLFGYAAQSPFADWLNRRASPSLGAAESGQSGQAANPKT